MNKLDDIKKVRMGINPLAIERLINTVGVTFDELGIKNIDALNDEDYYTEVNIDEEYQNFVTVVDGVRPIDAENGTYYRYVGPTDSKNRDFCKLMMKRTEERLLTREDISSLRNPGFGKGGSNNYSILKYRGGSFCRHKFVRYKVIDGVIERSRIQPGQPPI